MEKKGCREEAIRRWIKRHFGRVVPILTEKGSELKPGDPGRKYKGRVVFQGNEVRDEHWEYAVFSEMS